MHYIALVVNISQSPYKVLSSEVVVGFNFLKCISNSGTFSPLTCILALSNLQIASNEVSDQPVQIVIVSIF